MTFNHLAWAVFQSIVNAGLAVVSSGSAEALCGRFYVVCIPKSDTEREVMREGSVGHTRDLSEVFDTLWSGWYFVVQYEDGRLTHSAVRTEPYVMARFGQAKEEYKRFLRS